MREGLVEANPVIGTDQGDENGPRERTLSESELRSIWAALDDGGYGNIIKLLAFTGQRREEIGGLCRSEIDLDEAVISLPARALKNGLPQDIPLSDLPLDILKVGWHSTIAASTFSDRGECRIPRMVQEQGNARSALIKAGKEVARLDSARFTADPVDRTHDELGIAPHIVEAVL